MKRATILLLLLAGCTTTSSPTPQVSVEGPTFARSAFDCGAKPLPPDPKKAGTGKAGAKYENALGAWGDTCQAKLEAAGVLLLAAGQVGGVK